ncbi:MAG: protein kinase [Desulfuromonadaceae bacterium]|nr:protein kinase [Desulfuromonadaceae bacterium]
MNYGRYQIIKEVGHGSMGVVYQGRDPNIDRIVALKILRQDRMSTGDFARRFIKEAKVIGRLSHPSIVTIFDVGEDQGTVYIAMEFLEGIPLSDLMSSGRLEPDKIVDVVAQIAETLDYAHKKGVIHRDIKPSNIVMQPDGRIKITDFGIAHIEDPLGALQTQAGDIMGTPAYMSPEQVQGEKVDGRSDLFSLGVILYEMCVGSRPFGVGGKSLVTIFNEILTCTPPDPVKTAPNLPDKLANIINKALQKDPENRFQTGREISEALRNFLKAPEIVPPISPILSPVAENKPRKWLPVASVLLVSAIAGGVYFASPQKTSQSLPDNKPVMTENVIPKTIPESVPSVETKLPVEKPLAVDQPQIEKKQAVPVVVPQPILPEKTVEKKVLLPPKAPQQQKPVTVAPSTKIERKIVPPKAESRKPAKTSQEAKRPVPQSRLESKPATDLPLTPLALPRFAFLKVRSVPKGAKVYIDGALKGTTPLNIKMRLGEYSMRLSNPGYHDQESRIVLDKMKDYPIDKELKVK